MSIFRWIQVAVLAAVLTAFGYLLWQNDQRAKKIELLELEKSTLEASLTQAEEVNKSNEEFHKRELESAREAARIAEEALSQTKSRDRELRVLINELRSIPLNQRQPVSPIVCSTLDRLYPDEQRPACPD